MCAKNHCLWCGKNDRSPALWRAILNIVGIVLIVGSVTACFFTISSSVSQVESAECNSYQMVDTYILGNSEFMGSHNITEALSVLNISTINIIENTNATLNNVSVDLKAQSDIVSSQIVSICQKYNNSCVFDPSNQALNTTPLYISNMNVLTTNIKADYSNSFSNYYATLLNKGLSLNNSNDAEHIRDIVGSVIKNVEKYDIYNEVTNDSSYITYSQDIIHNSHWLQLVNYVIAGISLLLLIAAVLSFFIKIKLWYIVQYNLSCIVILVCLIYAAVTCYIAEIGLDSCNVATSMLKNGASSPLYKYLESNFGKRYMVVFNDCILGPTYDIAQSFNLNEIHDVNSSLNKINTTLNDIKSYVSTINFNLATLNTNNQNLAAIITDPSGQTNNAKTSITNLNALTNPATPTAGCTIFDEWEYNNTGATSSCTNAYITADQNSANPIGQKVCFTPLGWTNTQITTRYSTLPAACPDVSSKCIPVVQFAQSATSLFTGISASYADLSATTLHNMAALFVSEAQTISNFYNPLYVNSNTIIGDNGMESKTKCGMLFN
jgi:hypothetical protein